MNKYWILLVLGILVIIIPMPAIGLPGSWKTVALVIIGLGIVTVSISLMRSLRPDSADSHRLEGDTTPPIE